MLEARALLVCSLVALSGFHTYNADAQVNNTTNATQREARERFDQGLRLFNEGNNSGALAEFGRAYELSSNPTVLYNIALVQVAMGHPVEAVEALEKFLNSKTGQSEQDRSHAEELLKEQSRRVATLSLDNAPAGAVIELDGVQIGHSPLPKLLRVTVGTHVVSVVVPGNHPFTREVTLAGAELQRIVVELIPMQQPNGWIILQTQLPGADILVDGKLVGTTPSLNTLTVTPGKHRVELRRAGYQPIVSDTEVSVEGKNTIQLNPDIDESQLGATNAGTLRLRVSESDSEVKIDGHQRSSVAPVLLPAGQHTVVVQRVGFEPQQRSVIIPAGAILDLDVNLEPTPDTRQAYDSRTGRQQTWGWVAVASGAGITLGSVIFTVYNNKKLNDAQNAYDEILFESVEKSGRRCDVLSPTIDRAACQQDLSDRYDNLQQHKTYRTLGWVTAGAGAAVAVTGVLLLLTNDSPHRYDRRPTATNGRSHWYPTFACNSNSGLLGLRGTF